MNYKIDKDTKPQKPNEPTSLDTLLREIQAVRDHGNARREIKNKLSNHDRIALGIVMRGESEMSHPRNGRHERDGCDMDKSRHRCRENDVTHKVKLEAPAFDGVCDPYIFID